MIDPQAISPLLDQMIVGEAIGQGSSGTVYSAKNTRTERLYVVKHISVPRSPAQVEALILTGAVKDETEAQAYYAQSVDDLQAELEQTAKLSACPFIQPFTGLQIEAKTEGVGFDCYLLMPFSVSLQHFIDRSAMTHLRALNMSVDICSAMEAMREAGLIHCNIRPQNIFVNQHNQYMLGDIGAVHLDELSFSYLPDRYAGAYTAPELRSTLATMNETMDIYSLGLILYRIYNGNHAPFEDERTSPADAEQQRLEGAELPAPLYADYELAEIIRKACAFRPEDRYQTPSEFKQALVLYMKRNYAADELIVPPIYVAENTPETAGEPAQFPDTGSLDTESPEGSLPGSTRILPDLSEFSDISADEAEARRLLEDLESLENPVEPEYSAQTVQSPAAAADSASGEPEEDASGGHGKLIAVLLTLFIILCGAAAGMYYYMYIYGIQIDYIQAQATSTDTISVTINSTSADNSYQVVCSGGGETWTQSYAGATYVFEDLQPATEYTITVEAVGFREIRGIESAAVTTLDTTRVTTFAVTEVSASEAVITIAYEGMEPAGWTLTYATDDLDPVTERITGTEIHMTGLQSNTTYYFTLAASDDSEVLGTLECSVTTDRSVTLGAAKAVVSGAAEATVSWNAVGDYEDLAWQVLCEGSDGSSQEVTVTELSAVLSDLAYDTDYTVTISCSALPDLEPVTTTFTTPAAFSIENLAAEATDAGTVVLSWDIGGADDPGEWTVTYQLENSQLDPAVLTVTETEAVITGLIPDSTYTFEIAAEAASGLTDTASVQASTPAAEQYTDNGVSSLYTALYLQPETDSWTVNDLSTRRTSFSTSEGVAFAIEAVYGVDSDDSTVTVTIVVRDDDGTVVEYSTSEAVWDDLWTRSIYCGGLEQTPQAPGEYTIEVYFNGQLLTTLDLTVIEDAG